MMKRQLCTLVLAASMAIVTFTGCKKDAAKPNDNGGGGGTLKEKLVGSYKMTALTLTRENPDTQKDETTDVLAQYRPCDRDNLYVLKADMTTQVIDAGEQCSPSSNDTGAWSLPDENTITVDGQTYHLESIIGKTVKMSVEMEQEGAEATLNVTWLKQ